jgi:N utilization substance protein B
VTKITSSRLALAAPSDSTVGAMAPAPLDVPQADHIRVDVDPAAALAFYFDRFAAEEREDLPAEDDEAGAADQAYVEALVRGVTEHRAAIDDLLGQLSRNWRIERIARVERTILRMALYELKFRQDIPARVALNEAIELAKRFGSADAAAFVNGLLDSALTTLGLGK